MTARRRALVDAGASVLVALAIYAFFGHAFLNYDSMYALVWGQDLVEGRTPQYDAPVAPTPHPLAIAVGGLLSPLGESGAEAAFLALVLLGFGALVVALFRLGAESFGLAVGVLGAAIFLTRVPPLNFGIRGYVDLPTIALIAWAAVLEARRPRRGAAVLVLLGLAGLLRPEAWLFAGLYWLWLVVPLGNGERLAAGLPGWLRSLGYGLAGARQPRRDLRERAGLAALALAAPVLWLLSDLAVTGDALWSLHGTSDLAADLGRPTGIERVPELMPRRLGEILRLPELICAVGGTIAGLVWMRRRTLLPLVVAVLNGVAYVAFAVAGLSLLTRYLFLAAAMLSVLAALAVFGWRALPGGHEARVRWRAAGAVLLVALAVFFPVQAGRLGDLRDDIADRDRVRDDLHALVQSESAEAALRRCGTVFVPNHRPVPDLAYWLDRRPAEIVSALRRRPAADGLFLTPRSEVAELTILDPRDRTLPADAVPTAYGPVDENRSWRLFAGPACLSPASGR